MERRLAAIFAADVVGYSRLMGADEAGTLTALRGHREALIEPAIADHRGRIVKLMGDGVLAEFASAVNAAECAIAIQAGMAERNAGIPADRRLAFRIGINLGDVIVEGDDIYGDGVNIAARIEGLAEPGGVCISGNVHEQIVGKLDLTFEDLGEPALKNIDRRVRVYRIADGTDTSPGAGAGEPAPQAAGGAPLALPDKPSIAVLPFDNMSGDQEQEYFSDGISEDIITDLSKIAGLFVIARNSSFAYKGQQVDLRKVARELGVRYLLEGSVRRAGARVRITAQLIDAVSGGHLWAERYDRDLTDIFAVQDDVTRHIVDALKITLSAAEEAVLEDDGTANVEAHDCFLRGREMIFGPTKNRDMFDRSKAAFRRAIELDPDYAAPYAGLAMAYIFDYQNRWSDAPDRSLAEAGRFADLALEKNDKEPLAHYVAAIVAMFNKDFARWTDSAEAALALNPNFALANNARGVVHIFAGDPLQAIPYIERAMRLDPAYRQQYLHFVGTAYLVAGDYEAAATLFKERISLAPDTDLSRAFLAAALGHLGRRDEARQVWDELRKINPRYSFANHIARLPFKNPADAAAIAAGLEKADLPDPPAAGDDT